MSAKRILSVSGSEKSKRQNNLLYENLVYNGTYNVATEITMTTYDSESFKSVTLKDVDTLKIKLDKNKVNWIHVSGLSDTKAIAELCMKLGLSFPVVQDILNVRHIAKMEETCGTLFAVMDAYSYGTDSEMYSEHQSFILGPDFVISFEEVKRNLYEQIRKALEESIGQTRKMKSDYLFNLLINMVVDSYFEVIDILQNNLMDTEDLLMEFNSSHKETGQEIQHYRRDYSRLKKATSPLHEQFGHLLILEPALIEKSTRLYFRDTYDHLHQVSVMLDANREIIASLMDLYLANNDLRMNQIMKQLTVVATIFIPLTFLVGVWGMNFKFMPELSWKYGYLFSWLIMIVVGIIFYLWFRKKNLLR